MSQLSTEWIKVSSPAPHVLLVEFAHKPVNVFTQQMWTELLKLFERIPEETEDTRVVVLASAFSKVFTAGADLSELKNSSANGNDIARYSMRLRRRRKNFQYAIGAPGRCPVPVIAAVNGFCIGLGVDIISTCDVRYSSSDAIFNIREVALGMAPDIGITAYLSKIASNESLARELVFTALDFDAATAEKVGLVSKVVDGGRDAVVAAAVDLAKVIASNSPVATAGAKQIMNYARDHSVEENLDYAVTWNAAMLQTEDVQMAKKVALAKPRQTPIFKSVRSTQPKL